MAIPKLRKITQKRYIDPNTGKRVRKGTPNATMEIQESDCWYVDLRPSETSAQRIARRAAGIQTPKRKRIKLCSDKRAAQKMLLEMIESEEKQAAGFRDYHSLAHQDLGQLIDDFENHLRTTPKKKGGKRTEDYIITTIARIQKAIAGCGFLRLSDIDCEKVSCWLDNEREERKKPKPIKVKGKAKNYREIAEAFNVNEKTITYWRKKGAPVIAKSVNDLSALAKWYAEFSARREIGSTTSDHYTTALKNFGNWMVKPGRRTASNPFKDLDKLNDKTELRKQRRALSPLEFSRLIEAATLSDWVFRGLSGDDRALIYTLAAYTGLRAGEIASLKTNSFGFENSPTVTVKSQDTKNSKQAILPLRNDLARQLNFYLNNQIRPTLPIGTAPSVVWQGTWYKKGATMIKRDLKAAGIPYADDQGKEYDFHALRHQFITELSRAGVSLKSAQELARHSKPELTANVYTHLTIRDTAGDVERMPAIPTKLGAQNPTGHVA